MRQKRRETGQGGCIVDIYELGVRSGLTDYFGETGEEACLKCRSTA